MGQSVLVFVSHSSEDKESLIEPVVKDLRDCFISIWLDKDEIVPGENLRKSIFRDGLDKADIVLIFFTEKSLKSSWVDREIKHVLREEIKKGNSFDLSKIISIFDSKATYEEIDKRYPELTDDLLHLMPVEYDKIQLGKLVTAIWSKYLSLQDGDVETQKQILLKDKELFQKEKEIESLKTLVKEIKSKNSKTQMYDEFEQFLNSGKIGNFINSKENILKPGLLEGKEIQDLAEAMAFGLVEHNPKNNYYITISDKGKNFFKWLLLK